MTGTHIARIESREKNDIYAHLDNQGRYRVKMDFSREDAEPGYSYLWVHQAKPYSGDTYGWHTPLLDGTEVGIAYDDGNIDRPYIAYAFHDSEHQDIVTRDNRSQNILRTAAENELRMEDQRGQEHIALTTPFGGTQFNQCHIVDEQNKPRGSGFELSTDEYRVIRVFITADGQPKAAGRCWTWQRRVGLFARSGALPLNANEGPVQIQAQNGEMHLSAEQKLSLISMGDMLFAGKKKVTLIGGGSYLFLRDEKIEYGTSSTFMRKISC